MTDKELERRHDMASVVDAVLDREDIDYVGGHWLLDGAAEGAEVRVRLAVQQAIREVCRYRSNPGFGNACMQG